MHKQIKRVVPAHDPCSQNCSQVFSEPEQWCGMCFTWHREILALASPEYTSRVVWSRFRSKDWPSNPYEVARVFIPRAHRFYYRSNEFHEDIRFTLCFLENCTLIHVSKDLIQKAWVLRNSFLRRGRMKAKRTDLNRALSVLISLLQVPEISEHEAVPPALEKLKIFQNTSEESVCIIL
ncbi:hypothetical protein C0Q70_02350 [Pomacea canaliculata]|uniref:Uncharacterized protein n=1 Tax=Pomacea canaliculata TaxID=400727 RepID=A0A2T7PPP6_POMCA|nr:hypothetical protein C0Q70_02350 [Pomacea canaliculata]